MTASQILIEHRERHAAHPDQRIAALVWNHYLYGAISFIMHLSRAVLHHPGADNTKCLSICEQLFHTLHTADIRLPGKACGATHTRCTRRYRN